MPSGAGAFRLSGGRGPELLKTILVTGSAGHLGEALVRSLRVRQPVARVCVPIGHRRYSVTTRIYPRSAALRQDRRRNSNYSTSANFAVSLGTVLVPSTSTCCRL